MSATQGECYCGCPFAAHMQHVAGKVDFCEEHGVHTMLVACAEPCGLASPHPEHKYL